MIDMHVHSYYSDGDMSPSELVKKAKQIGLNGIALTDHDTFTGVRELIHAGNQYGVSVYAGVEISCVNHLNNRPMHILAYDLDETGMQILDSFLMPLRESMQEAVKHSIYMLEQNGYPVNLEKVAKKAGPQGLLYKQMIMETLMEAGLCNNMYGALYKELFKTGKNGQEPIAKLGVINADPFHTIRCIHEAGGRAVLAHPGQYDSYDAIEDLVNFGLDGIEVYHPIHMESDVERSKALSKKYNLICTGGSDYHGRFGEGEKLGECSVENYPF